MYVFNQIIIVVSVAITLFSPRLVQAQTLHLTASDKACIVKSILKRENFKDSEMWRTDLAVNTVYLLAENIIPRMIPQIKGIKFILITEKDVEAMKKTGVEYYRFGEFEVRKSSVRTSLAREYISERHANGSTVEYRCRKISGRWIIEGKAGAIYTAESQ